VIADGEIFAASRISDHESYQHATDFLGRQTRPLAVLQGLELEILDAMLRFVWWDAPVDDISASQDYDGVFEFIRGVEQSGMLIKYPREPFLRIGYVIAASTNLSWETSCAIALALLEEQPLVVLTATKRDEVLRHFRTELDARHVGEV
jgi:hypothetical protein